MLTPQLLLRTAVPLVCTRLTTRCNNLGLRPCTFLRWQRHTKLIQAEVRADPTFAQMGKLPHFTSPRYWAPGGLKEQANYAFQHCYG